MTTPAQVESNRLNALKSTGPKTLVGKKIASRNSLKAGLYAQSLVVPNAGETAEEFDHFRRRMLANLAPEGALERELAARIVVLLWRQRRIARYEAAVFALSQVPLPAHPDEVTGRGFDDTVPRPQNPSTVFRLKELRSMLRPDRIPADRYRRIVDLVQKLESLPAEELVDCMTVANVRGAAEDALGWDKPPPPWPPGKHLEWLIAGPVRRTAAEWFDAMGPRYPWPELLERHKIPNQLNSPADWTVDVLRRMLAAAAQESSRPLAEFLVAISERLQATIVELDAKWAKLHAEEEQLTERLLMERSQIGLAGAMTDDAAMTRVIKMESHLSRELDRALERFERLRASRDSSGGIPGSTPQTGFVLTRRGSRRVVSGGDALHELPAPSENGTEVLPEFSSQSGFVIPERESRSAVSEGDVLHQLQVPSSNGSSTKADTHRE